MQTKKRLGIVFMRPVPKFRGDFLTHIPLRMKKMLGEDVNVFVIYNGFLNKDKLEKKGVLCLKMPLSGHLKFKKLVFPIFLFIYTLFFTKKHRLDILMNANNHKWMIAVALATRLLGKRSVARITGNILSKPPHSLFGKIWFHYNKIIEKLSLRAVNKIICLSHLLKNNKVKSVKKKQKFNVISPGVDIEKFTMPEMNKLSKEPIKRLLFIGRLEPNKALSHALEAFKDLRREGYELCFDIYGDGSQESFLKKQYAHLPGICFHGIISHDEVSEELAKGGILILPSLAEGLPNIILEAMASGTFVIASNVGDNSILLNNGERGLLVDPKSSIQITKSIIYLLNNRKYLESAVNKAYKYIKRSHSFSNLREIYFSILFND